MNEEEIKLPTGDTITIDHDAAKHHIDSGAIPADVWVGMLKYLKEHGLSADYR